MTRFGQHQTAKMLGITQCTVSCHVNNKLTIATHRTRDLAKKLARYYCRPASA